MEEEQHGTGTSHPRLLPQSRTADSTPHLMESRTPPPTGQFPGAAAHPPTGGIDGRSPAVMGSMEPPWSTRHPSPAQYALSNMADVSKGGAYMTEAGRPPPSSPVLTPTYCSNCKKMFATIEAFTRHEPMHALPAKLHPCLECGKYYRHNTALVIHRRTHTGEKPYGCTECGRRFNARSSLVTHAKIHAGKKLCECSECGTSFPRPDDLFHHQLMHNRQRNFSCHDCGKSFKAESELAVHRRAHPAEELFLCSGCGRDFTQYTKLLRHQKSHPQLPPVLITGGRVLANQ